MDEPILVPVFGRGRALGAWPASKMDEDQITEAMQFLCGACSCEVKALNPGWDLLIDADWDKLLAAYGERDPSVVVKPAEPKESVLVAIPPAPAPAPATPVKVKRALGSMFTLAVLGIIGLFLLLAVRRRPL